MPEPREAPRPFWSGTISFGLVAVPVEIYSAIRTTAEVSLRMIAPDGAALRREYVCPKHHRALEPDEIVRAYERDRGDFVIVSEAELDALAPDATRNIELAQFVPREQLSPIWFERPYYLLPGAGAIKPYRLLAQVLEDSEHVGIASFVMRGKAHAIAILAEHEILRGQTLRFASELRSPADLGLPEVPAKVDAAAVKRMRALIRDHAEPDIDRAELDDETRAAILALAERKLAAGTDVVEAPVPEPGAEAEVVDLMEVLRRSLALPGSQQRELG